MAPRKVATKRRSDSPVLECDMETKKYRTRSSTKTRVSHKDSTEAILNEETEDKGKESDEDFVVDQEIDDKPVSAKLRTQNKRVQKSNIINNSNQLIPMFKPVNVDKLKIASELSLSDSDSDDSTSSTTASSSKYFLQCHSTIPSMAKQEQESDLKTCQFQETQMPQSTNVSEIWTSNLEALNHRKIPVAKNETNEEAQHTLEVETKKPPKKRQQKGKKTPNRTKDKAAKQEDKKDVDISELLKLEYMHANMSIDSEDDENWEKVKEEIVLEEQRKIPDKVEVMVDVGDAIKKKRKGLDIENMIRLKLNRIRREIQLDLHRVSLVGFLAHGYLINKMLNDPEIAASALSIVPQSGFPPSRTDLNYLEKLITWIHKHFKLKPKTAETPSYPGKTDVLRCISSSTASSKKELVYTSVALCRSLGILTRFVWSLQPLSAKVDASELQLKASPSDSNKSKKGKRDCSDGLKDDSDESSQPNTTPNSKVSKKNETNSKTYAKTLKTEIKSEKITSGCKIDLKTSSKARKTDVKVKNNISYNNANSKTSAKAVKTEIKVETNTSRKGKSESVEKRASKYFEDEKAANQKQTESKKREDAKKQKELSSKGKSNLSASATKSKGKQLNELVKEVKTSRSRRKSTEKPVNYQESPFDDTEEDLAGPSKAPARKKSGTREAAPKENKKKPRSKSRNSQPDSSDEFEAIADDDTEEECSYSAYDKRKSSPLNKNRKIISTDSEGDALYENSNRQEKSRDCNVWMEVYLEHEEQWMSVDVIGAKVHCDRQLERNATSIVYVIAFNPDLTWKDVTARYASSFYSVTRKQRYHRDWPKLLSNNLEKPTARSKAEDENLERSLTERPMPTSVSEFKNHPLYALQRHLLKFEGIYPPTAMPIGYIRGEPVYARECVKLLHSRDTWLKQAKVVRIGEKPYKVVKARPKWDRHAQKMISDLPLELFGEWQVEDYVPPPAVDGVVPRNPYGNVELFKSCMLPKGTVHLQIPGLNKVARRLGIDCAPAMTGWEARGGYSCPVYDGYVVCEENVEALLDAWQVANAEQEEREREKREKRVYGNWRRLIRGLLIKERLHAKYFSKLTEEEPELTEPVDVQSDAAGSKAKAPSKKRGASANLHGNKK